MSDFFTDEEMGMLEKSGKAKGIHSQLPSDDFISDGDMEKLSTKPLEKPSRSGEAFLGSFGNAATLGYLPHIQAALEKPMFEVLDYFNNSHTADDLPSYVARRDENIKQLEELSKENPKASLAGTIGGIGATALATAGAAGANLGARVLQSAKTGATLGGLANPGDTEGEVSLQLNDRAKNAALGGLLGAATQGGIEKGGKGIEALRHLLKKNAALKATRSLGRPTPTVATKMAESGQDIRLGRTLLDEGAVPWLGTTGRIAKRVEAGKEAAGETIEELLSKGGDEKLIDSTKMALELMDDPALSGVSKIPGMEGASRQTDEVLQTLSSNGELSLKEAQALRRGVDRGINFNKGAPEMRGKQETLFKVRTKIRDEMNDAVNALDSSAPKDQLLKANRKYGDLAEAEEILERQAGREQANRAVSLTDTIAASSGLASGNAWLGLAAGAANKFGRTFGNSIQARSLDSLAQGLRGIPKFAELEARNPKAFQTLLNRMAERTEASFSNRPLLSQKENPLLDNQALMKRFEENPELIEKLQDENLKNALRKKFNRSPTGDQTVSEEEARRQFLNN